MGGGGSLFMGLITAAVLYYNIEVKCQLSKILSVKKI